MDIKKERRKELKKKRAAIGQEVRQSAAGRCLEHLLKMKEFSENQWIYLYMSYGYELDTIEIILSLLKIKKRIAVPRVCGQKMKFHEITDLNQCEIGSYQIMEPFADRPVVTQKGMMLLPGLGFDKKGNRMGYGGGYYDRYLSTHPEIIKIGLAFDEQIIDQVPTDQYDISMDYILTPSGVCAVSTNPSSSEVWS